MNYLEPLLALVAAGAVVALFVERRSSRADIKALTAALQQPDTAPTTALKAANPRSVAAQRLRDSMAQVLEVSQKERNSSKSAAQYVRALLEGSPLALVATEPTGEIVWFSAAAQELFQRSPSDVRGKKFAALFGDSKARPGAHEVLFKKPANPVAAELVSTELSHLRADGQRISLAIFRRTAKVRDSSVEVFLLEDISERLAAKKVEDAAKAGSQRAAYGLQTAMHAVDDGVALFDADGKLMLSNRRFTALFAERGKPIELGSRLADVFPDGAALRTKPGAGSENPAAEATGRAESTFERLLDNGKTVKIVIHPGADDGVVAVCTDVSAIKALRVQIVREKQSRNLFLANLSHEIRTPLHGLLGAVDLLASKSFSPEQREYVELAKRSGESLQALIHQLLDFTKIDAGNIEIDEHVVEVREEIAFAVRSIGDAAHSANVQWRQKVGEDVPRKLLFDQVRYRQILTNLLSNAKRFTDRGSITVEVSMRSAGNGSEAPMMETRVRDTGIGISAADQLKLFQPFTQGNNNLSRKHGGMGLGLSITKAIVTAMHGDISLTSLLGRGTEIKVVFPVQVADASADVSPSPADDAAIAAYDALGVPSIANAEPVKQANEALAGLRILLVDDSDVNQELGAAVLRKRGANVDLCGDGASAVLAVASEDYDVVLMDIHMPGMDGFEATRRIRADQLSHHADVPIVAVTAHTLPGDRNRCLAIGMDEYVPKPFSASVLVEAIITAVGKRQPQKAAADSQAPARTPAQAPTQPPMQPPTEPASPATSEERAFWKARAYVGESDATFRKVAGKLLEQLPDVLGALRSRSDADAATKLVHRLGGAWSLFAPPPVATLPNELEKHLRAHGFDEAGNAKCQKLTDAIVSLQQALHDELNK